MFGPDDFPGTPPSRLVWFSIAGRSTPAAVMFFEDKAWCTSSGYMCQLRHFKKTYEQVIDRTSNVICKPLLLSGMRVPVTDIWQRSSTLR